MPGFRLTPAQRAWAIADDLADAVVAALIVAAVLCSYALLNPVPSGQRVARTAHPIHLAAGER